ncbi:MAG: phosphatidate cytidylyltransferase [Acidimicrobiales bacterium]
MAENVHEEPTPTQQVRIADARLASEISLQEADHAVDNPDGDNPDGGYEAVPQADQEVQTIPDELALPSWTDPPTGMVPAVLREIAREVGDTEEEMEMMEEGAVQGPSWREQEHEWEALDIDAGTFLREDSTVKNPYGMSEEGAAIGRRYGGDENGVNAPQVAENAEEAETDGGRSPVEDSAVPDRTEGAGGGIWHSEDLRGEPVEGESFSGAGPGDHSRQERTGTRKSGGRNLISATASGLTIGGLALASLYFGPVTAVIFCTIIVVLSSVECFATLRRSHRHPITLIGLAGVVAAMVAAYNAGVTGLTIVVTATTMLTGVWLVMVPRSRVRPVTRSGVTIFGFMWIGFLGSYSALLLNPASFPHRHGVAFLLGAIIATVATDVGAYALGSVAGRHHMAPVVSPHKTWEGYAGAVIASVVVSGAILPRISPWTLSSSLLLGLVVAVAAPLGDLLESMIKRELGVKDMGFLLPGHGGVLDRIDGLLFALPVTFFLVTIVKP